MGIGEGIVRKFVEEGAKVLVLDINSELGTKVASSHPEGQVVFLQGSVTKEEDWKKALETVLEGTGKLDIVVSSCYHMDVDVMETMDADEKC